MKNKGLLILASLILIVFIIFGTYNWYRFFLKASEDYGNMSPNETAGSLTLKDTTSVNDTNAEKLEDSQVSSVIPYIFQVENTKNTNISYNLLLEEIPVNEIKDGCTEETLLTKDQLKYQLKLNDKVIKTGLLKNIDNNILDSQSIKANSVNKYELRIYIHEDATDWTGKHFHYKVTLGKD